MVILTENSIRSAWVEKRPEWRIAQLCDYSLYDRAATSQSQIFDLRQPGQTRLES
jgi:hypothetical protein